MELMEIEEQPFTCAVADFAGQYLLSNKRRRPILAAITVVQEISRDMHVGEAAIAGRCRLPPQGADACCSGLPHHGHTTASQDLARPSLTAVDVDASVRHMLPTERRQSPGCPGGHGKAH